MINAFEIFEELIITRNFFIFITPWKGFKVFNNSKQFMLGLLLRSNKAFEQTRWKNENEK